MKNNEPTISFESEIESIESLEEAFNTAKEGNHEVFSYNGKVFLTSYAKYYIDYLKLKKHVDSPNKDNNIQDKSK